VIVGTPRSGTTLVQRLASELGGVRVPPETHFFSEFVTSLVRRWPPPLDNGALRAALAAYAGRDYVRGIGFDVDAVVDDLGGRCETVLDLYGAITRQLAGGGAPVIGEKTPAHLLWWRPLARALPDLKMVGVARDPRAVVASTLEVGWREHHVPAAARWNDDVRRLRAAQHRLGPRRFLLVRYEDAVRDPDGARDTLAAFLEVATPDGTGDRGDGELFASWETWKAQATGEVDAGRVERWRNAIDVRQQAEIVALAHWGMQYLGYDGALDSLGAWAQRMTLPPDAQWRRLQYVARRSKRQAEIARVAHRWLRPAN
jgi:hypothetical protein